MKDLRTRKAKKRDEADYKKWIDDMSKHKEKRNRLSSLMWGKIAWLPIAECPFKDFEHDPIFVTDGKRVCIAEPKKRFGTPVRVIKEPEMVMTDDGMAWVGGEYEKVKAPKWWFQWELVDVNGSMNYAGGHEIGQEEVPFIATHWIPMLPGFYE